MRSRRRRPGATLVALWVFAGGACGKEVVYDGAGFGRDPPALGALGGRLVTSNSGDDSLSVVDPAPGGAVTRLPVGFSPVELEGPHHLSADPQGRYVYVNLSLSVKGSGSGPHGAHGAGTVPGYVLKLDARDGREVGRAQVDPNPGDNVLTRDGKTLFVTHYDLIRWATHFDHQRDLADSQLVAVDTDTMVAGRRIPICPAAHGVRLSGDEHTLFATCGPDEIAVVDLTADPWAVRKVPLPGARETASCQRCPYALGVAPDGSVWVSSTGATGSRGGLDLFDPATGTFDPSRAVILTGSAFFPSFTGPAGDYRLYVPEQGPAGDRLRLFGPGAPGSPPVEVGSLLFSERDCLNAHALLVGADQRQGYLVCEGNHKGPGTLAWLDLTGPSLVAAVPVGVYPDGVTLVPAAAP
jgi:hypothetical protein